VAQDRIMEKVISEKMKQGMRKFPKSRNVDIHIGHLIKGDAWHLIQEIMISRLRGLTMEHDAKS
jgi:hypothetical protein